MIEINNIIDVEAYIDDIDLVIFDLDDTLYLEKDYVRSGYHAIERMLNLPGVSEELWGAFEAGRNAIDSVLAEHNMYSEDLKLSCLSTYRSHSPDIRLASEVRELLKRIRKSGKHLGIITDGRPEGQRAKIKALRLTELVDKIIITDELGGVSFRKPCATAYIKMRDYFKVPFEKTVYIGDNVQKDFIAPEKLGIRPIYYRNEDGLY